ncbi:MAG: hypothetical protein OXF84_02765 [Bacteroidetes bacterium]|nr:hypothetical protein [Bacteroidota bacterium]
MDPAIVFISLGIVGTIILGFWYLNASQSRRDTKLRQEFQNAHQELLTLIGKNDCRDCCAEDPIASDTKMDSNVGNDVVTRQDSLSDSNTNNHPSIHDADSNHYPLKLSITKVENFGKRITLDDDSAWWVYYPDSVKSIKWSPEDNVILRIKDEMDSWTVRTDTIFPYNTIIEHVKTGKMVGAERETEPRPFSPPN